MKFETSQELFPTLSVEADILICINRRLSKHFNITCPSYWKWLALKITTQYVSFLICISGQSL